MAKYHPVVIGVTGSVGKSSTKEAIALALSDQVRVRKSEGNYNNEIGIPLTILGTKSAGRSIWGWIRVSFRFLTTYLAGRSRYPEVLVLELGIDAPGDMDYLVSFLPIQVGVVTHISESHVEHFGSLAAIAKEKGKLIESLPPSGTAILSADDARVSEMQSRTQARVITYGFGEQADVRGDHLAFHPERNGGYTLKISYQGKSLPLRLPHIIARHHIPAVLAALAVAVSLKVNLVEVANTLAAFRPLPGRLNLLSGKYGTQLLDDTYNASPASTTAALAVLGEMSAPRKVVVLGDMLELGPESDALHAALAAPLQAANVSLVILVGRHMQVLYQTLFEKGFGRKQLERFDDPDEAALALPSLLRPNDLILVKGSQGVRMEKISEALLAENEDAEQVLCRQTPVWKGKPFVPPAEWQA